MCVTKTYFFSNDPIKFIIVTVLRLEIAATKSILNNICNGNVRRVCIRRNTNNPRN